MELNTISFSDFTALATVIFEKSKMSLPQEARNSGMFRFEPIPENSGDTRKYTEIDTEEYATKKNQGGPSVSRACCASSSETLLGNAAGLFSTTRPS